VKSKKESSFKVFFPLEILADFFSVVALPLLLSTKNLQVSLSLPDNTERRWEFVAKDVLSACEFFLWRSKVFIFFRYI
jgi:hypothetical protein